MQLGGLAAFSVVLFHYFFHYNNLYDHSDIPVQWTYLGQYGVHLFFIVSGFVIFWTLHRVKKPVDFLVSRFSRLYPAYWSAVILTFILVLVFGLQGRQVPIESAILNLLMFHEYFGVPHVDGVYWTLTVELTFYFWIFVIYIMGQLERVEFFFLPIIAASILESVDFLVVPYWIDTIFIFEYAMFFLAGISFYRLAHNQFKTRSYLIISFTLFSTIYIYSYKHFVLFTLLYFIFFLATSGKLVFLRFKPLVFLGSISYSLYLLHQNIGYLIINYGYSLGFNPIISIMLALMTSISLASIFFIYIEKPMLTVIRKKYKDSNKIQELSNKLTFATKKT